MTVGEIKISTLKLMFDLGDEDISAGDINALMTDSNYASRLVLMNESINRAIDRIVTLGISPPKLSEPKPLRSQTIINLKELLPDFVSLEKILTVSGSVVTDYMVVGGNHIVLKSSGEYVFVYKHKPLAVTGNEQVVDLEDRLVRLIPYFVKSDLFEEDNPSLAFAARNVFDNTLQEYLYAKQASEQSKGNGEKLTIKMEQW